MRENALVCREVPTFFFDFYVSLFDFRLDPLDQIQLTENDFDTPELAVDLSSMTLAITRIPSFPSHFLLVRRNPRT
jgi:hypothetical protein